MKVLLLNCVYNQGSTGKIVSNLHHDLIEAGNISYVFYGSGPTIRDKNVSKICTNLEHNINALICRFTGEPFGGFFYSNKKVIDFIQKEKPDIVHIHCINGYMINIYSLLTYLAKHSIKTVLTQHAEFFFTGSCSHSFDCIKWQTGCYNCKVYKKSMPSYIWERSSYAWNKMMDALSQFDETNLVITSVSPWLMNRSKQSAILSRFENRFVPNGVDTHVFKRRPSQNRNRPCILFVAPHFFPNNHLDQKGGRYLLRIAQLCPEYDFKIVASKASFDVKDLPNNVSFLGSVNNQIHLSELYSNADITLILSRRETFSMVTVESLCCGTPVVGFKAGGPESIAIEDYSIFVEYGDITELLAAMKKFICSQKKSSEIEVMASQRYSFNTITNQYLDIYKQLIYG